MPNPAPAESIIGTFVLLGLVWLGVRLLTGPRSTTLIVQKFHIAVTPGPPQQPSVEIVGRTQGIVAFALSLMGFSPVTRFVVAGGELRCQITSLSGQESQFVPLRSVSSLTAGVKKSIAALVMATAMTMIGICLSFGTRSLGPFAIFLVIAIVCVVYYFLSKKVFIAVHPHGGPSIQLVFKPNVIEGVPISVEQAFAVVGVVRDMILSDGRTTIAPSSPAADPSPPSDAQTVLLSEAKPEEVNAEEEAKKRLIRKIEGQCCKRRTC